MIPNILMAVGGSLWLGGELYGVHRNQTVENPGNDTTSQWTWWAERKWPILRPLIAVFFLSLVGHFLWHGVLLP